MKYQDHPERIIRHLASMPFIYFMIVPSIFLDISAEVYHRICFVLYGIPYVERSKYIKIDRHKIESLTLIQKVHCMYCGYVNGLMNYCVQIAAETEKYWCGIQHQKDENFVEPNHHKDFVEYEVA